MSAHYECTLSAETLKKAKQELNENPDTRQSHLDELRSMFKQRPDIKFRLDDAFLIRFLRVRKFDVKRAFKNLVHYYEVKSSYKEIFKDFVPSSVRQPLEDEIHLLLPQRDKEGRQIVVVRPGRWNPDTYSIAEAFKLSLMFFEKLTEDEEVQVNGMVVILDYSDMTMRHAKQLNPLLTRKMADAIQNALPLRLKAIHYVNQPKIFDIIFGFFKPFMSDKMLKRLHFHGDECGTLHKYIESSILPTEYGGSVQNLDNKEWIQKLSASEEDFIENNKYGFPKSEDTLGGAKGGANPDTGLVGTFKSLNVD